MYEPTFLTLSQAARKVGKSRQTIFRWAKTGHKGVILKSIKIAGTRGVREADLHAFLLTVTQEGFEKEPETAKVDPQRYGDAMEYLNKFWKK
jgi:hypothetical protein